MNEKIFCYLIGSPLIVATSLLVECCSTSVERALELEPVIVLDSSFEITD